MADYGYPIEPLGSYGTPGLGTPVEPLQSYGFPGLGFQMQPLESYGFRGLGTPIEPLQSYGFKMEPISNSGQSWGSPPRPTRQRNRLKDLLSMYLPDEFTMMFK